MQEHGRRPEGRDAAGRNAPAAGAVHPPLPAYLFDRSGFPSTTRRPLASTGRRSEPFYMRSVPSLCDITDTAA